MYANIGTTEMNSSQTHDQKPTFYMNHQLSDAVAAFQQMTEFIGFEQDCWFRNSASVFHSDLESDAAPFSKLNIEICIYHAKIDNRSR
jgi:hypothetical protein